jgi:HD superfamily phosphohydrolase
MARQKARVTADQGLLPLKVDEYPKPDFTNLLRKPAVKLPLPLDFDVEVEAQHLQDLWDKIQKFRRYKFEQFIHAGGSGMVWRVKEFGSNSNWAMKIARKKVFDPQPPQDGKPGVIASPFSDTEISALEQISHPNVVSLRDRIAGDEGIVALVTSYVETPQPLDEYLRAVLSKDPDPERKKGLQPFSPERLDGACAFLVQRFTEMSSALAHMHEKQLFHCDIKSANILIGSNHKAILTDLGSSVSLVGRDIKTPFRINFTWTYAHPDLRELGRDVRGISGGGLKVSVNVEPSKGMERFDLFALGRTIQEALAILVLEFGERCYAAYGFRFLHVIACLLLDGKNSSTEERLTRADERRFVGDITLDCRTDIFARHKITSASDLSERLDRFDRDYGWQQSIPELDSWQPEYVNTGSGLHAPYTERVEEIFRHPTVRRLRGELQLGWVRDVYPGATHTRWSHTLGVFANVCQYYNALLADPELPLVRILLDKADIEHGLVAAILHDIGQTAFGHDLEVINPSAFSHEALIPRLLNDRDFGGPTLAEAIKAKWKNVDISRVLTILGIKYQAEPRGKVTGNDSDLLPVDGLARDMINGPIDADKLDYLIRDSSFCAVPYGAGIDRERFLRSLTVKAQYVPSTQNSRLALAYRAKGAAAIESLLLARYQMYGAVYWHHTYRCIQAMLVQAAAATFSRHEFTAEKNLINSVFYAAVVCKRHVDFAQVLSSKIKERRKFVAPPDVALEPALEFVWQFSDDRNRRLIEKIASRDLYKRVYEVRTGELHDLGDYTTLQEKFSPQNRIEISRKLEDSFLRAVHKEIAQKGGPTESVSESQARGLAQTLSAADLPLVVVDYPIRGVPDERNIPQEISDPSRKYISGRTSDGAQQQGREIFGRVRRLQIENASVRVFAERELHLLIVRYLDRADVQSCIFEAMPFLESHR